MSTAAQVRAAWAAGVWQDPDLLAISPNVHAFDMEAVAEINTAFESLLMHGQEINFWQYGINKSWQSGGTYNQQLLTFTVSVKYFLEAETDTDGANYNAVIDAFETLYSTVEANIGNSWSSTVEFRTWQPGPPIVKLTRIRDRRVWAAEMQVEGYQSIAAA